MKKIKILDKSFPTSEYGVLESGLEYNVCDSLGDFCVKKMKSAVFLSATKKPRPTKKADI